MSETCEGNVQGAEVMAAENDVPRFINRSSAGEVSRSYPYPWMWSARNVSMEMRIILGFLLLFGEGLVSQDNPIAATIHMTIILLHTPICMLLLINRALRIAMFGGWLCGGRLFTI